MGRTTPGKVRDSTRVVLGSGITVPDSSFAANGELPGLSVVLESGFWTRLERDEAIPQDTFAVQEAELMTWIPRFERPREDEQPIVLLS